MENENTLLSKRFRGFFPVVIDVETGGFNPHKDALLEIGAVTLGMDAEGNLAPKKSESYHVIPFAGSNIEDAALAVNRINLTHPLRTAVAVPEHEALHSLFQFIREGKIDAGCSKAVLVGHNATFDLSFINAASARCGIKRNPFHLFTVFDTATLGALAYGQTVLTKAAEAAGIAFNSEEAHSARYDAEKTAVLFCTIVNRWKALGGWIT